MEPSPRLRTIAGTFLITCLLWVGGLTYWRNTLPAGAGTITEGVAGSAQSGPQSGPQPGTLPAPASVAYQAALPAPFDTSKVPALVIPVQGVQPGALIDTFTQARENGARVHDAIDIPASLGTPVLAAASGTVEKLFSSAAGGLTIYIRCDDRRFVHYYAHLDRYADGLHEGQRVQRGEIIGAVGFTGNANPAAPHLHFAIQVTTVDAKWYEPSTALNPYPLLKRR